MAGGRRGTEQREDHQAVGTQATAVGRWAPRERREGGTSGSQFPSPRAAGFPDAPPLRTKRRKRAGRGGARPLLHLRLVAALSIQNLFLMERGCHPLCPRSRLPLAANQSGPSPRAKSDWGRVSLALQSLVPPPRPEGVYPALPATFLFWKRSSGLAVRQRRNVASRGSRLDACLGWGCGGRARRGPRRTAEEEE